MIKEPKNIDFYTTGRQPSEKEFARITEWIKKDKERQALRKRKTARKRSEVKSLIPITDVNCQKK